MTGAWLLASALALHWPGAFPQAKSASVCGTVRDPTNAGIASASLKLSNENQTFKTSTGESGNFCILHLAAGDYTLEITARGFRPGRRQIELRSGEERRVEVSLKLETISQNVTVEGVAGGIEAQQTARTDVTSTLIARLPSESTNAALSSIMTLASPGVAADSNGVFHPLGEHAETSFSVDGQPISDQQSRIFSNQISLDTIQDMQILRGAPTAEFGDKTSLIALVTTRSGLNEGKLAGTFSTGYGSFGTSESSLTLASGSERLGNFLALDGVNSGRFLDTPEFVPLHAHGNAENLFDRSDYRPSDVTSIHVDLSAAHSWFQTPNTYDQESAAQDQRQHMASFNAALGYSRVLNPDLLLTGNAWARQDRVEYFASADLLADQPATLSQSRRLTNAGARADVSYSRGRNTARAGIQVQATPLSEAFSTGLTDPAFNSPCVDSQGVPVGDPSLTETSQCSGQGYAANRSFQPALVAYDLTRGGTLFNFQGAANIYEGSAYAEDSSKFGPVTLNLGLRFDSYSGLSSGSGVQPRGGISYGIRSTGTGFHISYARIFLTPYNENLVLSSATGEGGLANGSLGTATVEPLFPARRNQFNTGFEQSIGNNVSVNGEYFWKFTQGAYDFNVILNTPLAFPVQFRKAKIDGGMLQVTLKPIHGFSAFTSLGHTRSRLFSPEIGGIDFGQQYAPVARPDHDQNFQQTTYVRYEFGERGPWIAATWRFDSGLVAVSVPDYATALTLTGDEQRQIGLYCGNVFATVNMPLRSCNSPNFGATLISIVPAGTFNPDTNPTRIAPRNLFDLGAGADNLWKTGKYAVGVKVTVVNIANKVALYNFLSSFSGTHFVEPRTIEANLTLHF